MPFNEPDTSGRLNPRDIIGHLLLVWPTDYVEHSPTKYTKPGQPSDVIVVDVVDLDDVDFDGSPGRLSQNVWWRPARLIASLKRQVGTSDPYLAWMKQGGASQGMNAPFVLVTATGDPAAVAKAEAWLSAHPDFKPSGSRPQEKLGSRVQDDPGEIPGPEAPRQETVLERLARMSQQGASRLQSPPEDIPF